MTDDVLKLLRQERVDPAHQKMLDSARSLVKGSRAKMSTRYEDWDLQDRVYRGEKCPDLADRKAEQAGKPVKMVVPHTFAQVMTFTSFLFLMFNQNQRFYTLNPTGAEDYGTKQQDCETLLERDLRRNEWNTRLFQHLLDIARFGTGILETSWTEDIVRAWVPGAPRSVDVNGIPVAASTEPGQWERFLKYQGNEINNISPYRFFPDAELPLVDFQKGRFCAVEEDFSMERLYDLESKGEVAGVKFIQPLPLRWDVERGGSTRTATALDAGRIKGFDATNPSSIAIVTKMQWWIVPNQYSVGPGDDEKLGPEDFPILYHVWYANDNRLIKLEQARNWHNEFSFTMAQFTPDMHHTITLGLADLIYRLQDVISWLINSHVTSVRRVIANRLLVDPKLIDTRTLDGEGDIYMKKSVSVPLDRALYQLKVQDVTGSHMADSELMAKVMQVVTGVSDSMQGQYSQGRRDATQSRNVAAGAMGRMKMHGHLIFESSLGRQGRHMLTNLRQNLDQEPFAQAIGSSMPPEELAARFAAFKGTPKEVICASDFFMFDSTHQSEKGFLAQSLQELLTAIMSSNPAAAMQLLSAINPAKVMSEMFQLRGAGPIGRFGYSEAERQQMQAMQVAQMQQQASPAAV